MGKYICGKNSVLDAISNGVVVKTLYVLKPIMLKNKSIDIRVISKDEMDKITKLNHQGFIAILNDEFSYFSLDELIKKKPNIVLVLDHIEDPHNLGAIIRTVNASGIKHIVIPKNRAAKITETVLKVSSGGIVGINIVLVNSLQAVVKKFKKNNYWIYASSVEKGISYNKVSYNFPLVIVIGNESKGVSRTLLKQSDQKIFIPMIGTVQSLNASVATGIILFEIIKNLH